MEWLARDNLKTNLITIKSETSSYVVEQFSWVPLPSCSLPGDGVEGGGGASQLTLLLCQHVCLLRQLISKCEVRIHFQAMEGVTVSATLGAVNYSKRLSPHWINSWGPHPEASAEPGTWQRPSKERLVWDKAAAHPAGCPACWQRGVRRNWVLVNPWRGQKAHRGSN